MTRKEPISLLDKYTRNGRVYLTGSQALVRLPMVQKALDKARGLNSAGFISGYRGSPLGNYDIQLQRATKLLAEHDVVFRPGINEELAATAVWGSQQVGLRGSSKFDGVFGIWYGKGPGVDRTGDAFRHGNLAGTSPNGGVLALLGDDHTCESSTTCHQSEFAMVDAMMPVINPSSVEEIIEYGLHGWAMSRYSGCWIGLKCVNDTVSTSASVEVKPDSLTFLTPQHSNDSAPDVHIRVGDTPREQEARLQGPKLEAAQAYWRVNGLDRITVDSDKARIGVVTTGKSYLDVRQAMTDLGISADRAKALGLRVYKVGLVWPLEPSVALEFAQGLDSVLVVEEKRSLIETQLKTLCYDAGLRPTIVGKFDTVGATLLQSTLDLSSNNVAIAIARAILASVEDSELRDKLARIERIEHRADPIAPMQRSPYFCAGCPHSSSTHLPDGSRGMAGIGCAYLSQFMERGVDGYTQMGGEGATWIGEAPFSGTGHIFQNLGDGTYFHSGSLAIRAAVAANINITFKILFNDAVAMTGGQPHDGTLTPWSISQQVHSEGVVAIAIVTDEPNKYPDSIRWPAGTTIDHRRDLDEVQRRLRDTPGTTVLIYDQTCAAEKRRRRKRKLYPDPAKRLFINSDVCEGCGDCGLVSNCTALLPKETPLGRKREIDQSACNKDYSCVNGFCPSFVTILGGDMRCPTDAEKSKDGTPAEPRVVALDGGMVTVADSPVSANASESPPTSIVQIPEPEKVSLNGGYNIVITGVGGTGVITIGALMGMAAHIEGIGCAVLDMTGMAQKGGAVMSHLRMNRTPADIDTIRIADGGADLVIGCDSVVTSSIDVLKSTQHGSTNVLLNSREVMPGQFTRDANLKFPNSEIESLIATWVGDDHVDVIDATELAVLHLGDAIASNLIMLGYAFQKGLVPLALSSIIQAINLNGIAIDMNLRAFQLGRELVAGLSNDPPSGKSDRADEPVEMTAAAIVKHRSTILEQYQNSSYARRYIEFVEKARDAESRVGVQGEALTTAVAKYYFKILAYKDEYEVARLYSTPKFRENLRKSFSGNYKVRFNLAPPLISKRDSRTGHLIKREFGSWLLPVFGVLARLKGLRGTPLDLFGYTEERKAERKIISDYEIMMSRVFSELSDDNFQVAVLLAGLPEMVRGFGHVKIRHLKEMERARAQYLGEFRRTQEISQ